MTRWVRRISAARTAEAFFARLAARPLNRKQFAHSARGELLRRAGRRSDALTAFQKALELARQEPEKRFLTARIRELSR